MTAAVTALIVVSCGEDREYQAEAAWSPAYLMQAEIGSDGITDLWFNGPNDGWACVDDKILHYDGSRWTVAHKVRDFFPQKAFFFDAISAVSPDNIWVAGEWSSRRSLYHYNGNTWEEIPTIATYYRTRGIYFPSDTRGWMANGEGVFYYNNGNWTLQIEGEGRDLCFVNENNGWAAVSTYVYHWDGFDWTRVELREMDDGGIYGISAASADLWWAVGNGQTEYEQERDTFTLFYRYDGTSWEEVNWPENYYGIEKCGVAADGTGWVLDYGSSWPTQLWAHNGTRPTERLYLEKDVINDICVLASGEAWVCSTSLDTNITRIWHYTTLR